MAHTQNHLDQSGPGSFARNFGIAPFTVLNAREGWWQKRKKQWIALGIESEQGRIKDLIYPPSANAFLTKAGKQALITRRHDNGGK